LPSHLHWLLAPGTSVGTHPKRFPPHEPPFQQHHQQNEPEGSSAESFISIFIQISKRFNLVHLLPAFMEFSFHYCTAGKIKEFVIQL